jgi:oxygen-independent coproporphyrinogen-3 oxidase
MSLPTSFLPDDTLFESFTFPFFQFDYSCDHTQLHRAFLSVPDSLDARGRRGLYVHIPFCDTICTFCPFLKSVGSAERIANYLNALEHEMDAMSAMPRVRSWKFDSVYIGGGTPSVLSPEQASRLIKSLKSKFAIVEGAELTFEVEAKSATTELLHAVAEAGATRISFGIQTLDPTLRKIVNLTASVEEIQRTIEVGSTLFDDVNADMIVGFPGQRTDDALADLIKAAGLGASSISLYPMDYSTVMSKLLDRMRTGSLPEPASV